MVYLGRCNMVYLGKCDMVYLGRSIVVCLGICNMVLAPREMEHGVPREF